MAGRWSDEWRDRGYRGESDWRDEEAQRWSGSEDRSWSSDERAFGERESGVGYNRPRGEADYSRPDLERRGNWQDRDYGGASPAMRRGEYDTGYRARPRFQRQDYTRGGRYYGDDGRSSIYREEYGVGGGYDYGAVPRGYDENRRMGGREGGGREGGERWRGGRGGNAYGSYDAGSYGARTFSGGTGGYDYERGYGDGGRNHEDRRYGSGYRGQDRDHDRGFEERAHDAGDFFRRTGEKVKSWFSDMSGGDHDYDDRRHESYRGARGLGPKGYKRSDERISEEVHQRLTDDSWLDASNINCSVSGGEVTLSGTVDSREAKHRAERIVEDLSGVSHVQNNLRVQSGSYLTSAGRGYGDSAQEAQMRRDDPVKDVTDGETRSVTTNGDDGAATRTTTRRT